MTRYCGSVSDFIDPTLPDLVVVGGRSGASAHTPLDVEHPEPPLVIPHDVGKHICQPLGLVKSNVSAVAPARLVPSKAHW